MGTGRLEAFSDGVIAIIITIMVLELHAPEQPTWAALRLLLPKFLAYVLSFVYVGIYWNNHHHLLRITPRVSGGVLWANLNLLFWLSLIPFTTAWAGEHYHDSIPAALYGVVLLAAAIAYWLLQCSILSVIGRDSDLGRALGTDWKGKLSPLLYAIGVGMSFVSVWIAQILFAAVAAIWFVPDRRIERQIIGHSGPSAE